VVYTVRSQCVAGASDAADVWFIPTPDGRPVCRMKIAEGW